MDKKFDTLNKLFHVTFTAFVFWIVSISYFFSIVNKDDVAKNLLFWIPLILVYIVAYLMFINNKDNENIKGRKFSQITFWIITIVYFLTIIPGSDFKDISFIFFILIIIAYIVVYLILIHKKDNENIKRIKFSKIILEINLVLMGINIFILSQTPLINKYSWLSPIKEINVNIIVHCIYLIPFMLMHVLMKLSK